MLIDNPYSKFFQYVENFCTLTEDCITEFSNYLEPVKIKKKTLILEQGSVCTDLFIIGKGGIREFVTTTKMEEVTVWIGFENDFALSLPSFISQKPSYTALQTTEDCLLFKISQKNIYTLYDKHHCMDKFGRRILEKYVIESDTANFNFRYLSAEQRHDNLMRYRPEMFQRVPLQYIASLLGIKNETLSRIRAKKTSPVYLN